MTLCQFGKISLICFVTASLFAGLPELLLRFKIVSYSNNIVCNVYFAHALQFIALNFILLLAFRGFNYQVAVRSNFLGYVFGIGILVLLLAPASWRVFGAYTAILANFHYSEFLAIAWTNPSAAKIDSFVLQHSLAYGVAACASWAEFFIERYFFPSHKEFSIVSFVGLILCIGGEAFRKTAMFTAKRNFNHVVQTEKLENHELVTHGVYRLCRHPSYVGWFYWSIGTQLILQNPVCLLAYAVASWKFFHYRVLLEEITLLNFFGESYVAYQQKVGTGLPFISGYRINL